MVSIREPYPRPQQEMSYLHIIRGKQLLCHKLAIRKQYQEKDHLDYIAVDAQPHCNPIGIPTIDEWPNGQIQGIKE